MSAQRSTIIRGPGAVMFGAQVMHDADGIEADIMVETQPIATSMGGKLDEWASSRHGEVQFRPAGELSAGILAALFPYQNPTIGASIYGGTDIPLIVHSAAGVKIVFTAAALVACPSLILSPTKIAFAGKAKFNCVLGNGLAPTAANALLTPPAASAFSYATYPFDGTTIKGAVYVGTYNPGAVAPATPLVIETLNGWQVDMTPELEDIKTDHEGLVDQTLKGVTVVAKCAPTQLSESALLGLIPYAAAQGSSMRTGIGLAITSGAGGGALSVTLNNVAVLKGPLKYGATTLRDGELAFVAHRNLLAATAPATGNTPDAICSIAMA